MASEISVQNINHRFFLIRGIRVMLDSDIAKLYGVETGALNRAVQRNKIRFPADFMFQLTEEESLRCQIGISNGRTGRPCEYRNYEGLCEFEKRRKIGIRSDQED